MDRVKQFLRVRPLLERRPPAEASALVPVAAPAQPSDALIESSPRPPPVARDRGRNALLMLMLLRTLGRRT
ncbi:MAG: hypothetical protein KA144_08600 [Xanthomonadaceae bacterium]|nr:hypothetical protein [Xanthomonadaceae bacterium]